MKRSRAAMLMMVLAPAWGKDTCADCHGALDGRLKAPVVAFANDVHGRFGLACADCHGGDRNAEDPGMSMSRAKGFQGKIARTAVAQLCAHCHSDAGYMHKYKPQQRVDQYAQYQTSVHGKRMAAGDAAVANCVDCHGVHSIREVKDPLSPVHPLRLPETCARCHANPAHMAPYKLPTSQFVDYRKSVHWQALAQRRDLSAPSCASCHGNHGATPPQVTAVANVCGSCHALIEELYNKSPHQPMFAAMNQGGCVVCHSNHAVMQPSPAMLSGAKAVCAQCHEGDSAGGKAAVQMAGLLEKLRGAIERSDSILERARRSGMEVSDALAREQEAQEALVKARVSVHGFNTARVEKQAAAGLAIAAETYSAGEKALWERDYRRIGLAIALLAILATMLGLRLALRTAERPPAAAPEMPRR